MYVFEDWLSKKLCVDNKDAIIVYGDNLNHRGASGQAIIRDEVNTLSLPTRRIPAMSEDSFFSDRKDEIKAVTESLDRIRDLHKQGITIILPVSIVGSGLAKLISKSPKIYKLIKDFYLEAGKRNKNE